VRHSRQRDWAPATLLQRLATVLAGSGFSMKQMEVVVARLSHLPAYALAPLLAESEREGWRFVRRLADEWAAGTNTRSRGTKSAAGPAAAGTVRRRPPSAGRRGDRQVTCPASPSPPPTVNGPGSGRRGSR
jgi:hypothetical protein